MAYRGEKEEENLQLNRRIFRMEDALMAT